MKKLFLLTGLLITVFAAYSFITDQQDPWKVPEKYENLKNPVPADEASIASGKELYDYFCVNCHGNDGKGSGKRALKLNNMPTDFTLDIFQQQSDGALLYKIYSGHSDMPGFKKRIPGNQDAMDGSFGKTRIPGDLVTFIRSFGKKNHH